MTEEDKIKEVFYKFEDGGLISKNPDIIMSCLSDTILGIGIGEQGFVASKEDVLRVLMDGIKQEEDVSHFLDYGRMEIRLLKEDVAILCADVIVTARCNENATKSRFSQSLTLIKEADEWKISGLHASAPVVTEENIEAYPLKFAEKTLKNLKEKFGGEIYAVEEQYRMAVLSDTIAFYIINFSKDIYEKCQLNSELCAYVEEGSRYEQFARDHIDEYVVKEDRELYLECFSLENIHQAFLDHKQEVKCEYRMLDGQKGSSFWVLTVIRLITDIATGEKKGIMYVKNIDGPMRQQLAMREQAEYDSVLKIYNKSTFISHVDSFLIQGNGVLIMLDIDNFKEINDTYGHPFGDKVLISVAGMLKDIFSEHAFIGRLGGDEFGVFLKDDCGEEQIKKYMRTLYRYKSGLIIGENRKISFSVGISRSSGNSCFKDFYQEADIALYLSKHGGKNKFSFFEE